MSKFIDKHYSTFSDVKGDLLRTYNQFTTAKNIMTDLGAVEAHKYMNKLSTEDVKGVMAIGEMVKTMGYEAVNRLVSREAS